MAQKRRKKVAVVACLGGSGPREGFDAGGAPFGCAALLEQHPEGSIQCGWGCLGGGDCVAACKVGAMEIGPAGAAEVNREACIGCGLCVKACPRALIRLSEREYPIQPRCSNKDDGPATRKVCATGCIACRICEKNCPADAIRVEENRALLDESRCIACGMCAVKCLRGVIEDSHFVLTARR